MYHQLLDPLQLLPFRGTFFTHNSPVHSWRHLLYPHRPEKSAPTPLAWFPGEFHKVSTIICLSQPGSLWLGRVRKQENMSQLVAKGEAPSTGVMNKLRFLLSSSHQHPPTAPLLSQHHTKEEQMVPRGCGGQPLRTCRLGAEQLRGDSAKTELTA